MVFSGIVEEIGEVLSFDKCNDIVMWDGSTSSGQVYYGPHSILSWELSHVQVHSTDSLYANFRSNLTLLFFATDVHTLQ